MFSNCDSSIALNRYTQRHDAILYAIADWIYNSKLTCQSLYVDINNPKFKPISDLFDNEFRPDLVILQNNFVTVLELTVCHETNMVKSKLYKLNKYCNISKALKNPDLKNSIKTFLK